nr:hypothetical protein [uncultured Undibacterium sp.]
MNTVNQAMQTNYQTRQWVTLLWIILPLLTLGVGAFDGRNLATTQLLQSLLLIAVINLLVLGILGHLTIKVNEHDLQWQFGIFGWPKWQLKFSDIAHVEVCQTMWFEGKGIRFTREGMLYNAAGNGAVRITKADGKKIRIGSVEPEILCAQISARLNSQSKT